MFGSVSAMTFRKRRSRNQHPHQRQPELARIGDRLVVDEDVGRVEAADERGRVFDRFYRVDGDRNDGAATGCGSGRWNLRVPAPGPMPNSPPAVTVAVPAPGSRSAVPVMLKVPSNTPPPASSVKAQVSWITSVSPAAKVTPGEGGTMLWSWGHGEDWITRIDAWEPGRLLRLVQDDAVGSMPAV